MKSMGTFILGKKCYVTLVILCATVTIYMVTQNTRHLRGYSPNRQSILNIERSRNTTSARFPLQLSLRLQSKIKTFVLFIGYPRSGHTLIGSLLDAHPHIIIANELDIGQRWQEWSDEQKTRENMINKLYENSNKQTFGNLYRSPTKLYGRTYAVPNQWQGKYKDFVQVIGDKKGGKTTSFFATKAEEVRNMIRTINLPLQLIHMVRNPYDNIATMLLRQLKIATSDALAAEQKVNYTMGLLYNVRLYLRAVYRNNHLLTLYGSNVMTLHSEDVIQNPGQVLSRLCSFLNVSCTEDYLNDCASIVYKSSSLTRHTVVWTPSMKQLVENAIEKVPFLKRYSFDS